MPEALVQRSPPATRKGLVPEPCSTRRCVAVFTLDGMWRQREAMTLRERGEKGAGTAPAARARPADVDAEPPPDARRSRPRVGGDLRDRCAKQVQYGMLIPPFLVLKPVKMVHHLSKECRCSGWCAHACRIYGCKSAHNTSPSQHEGQPRGRFINIHPHKTHASHPSIAALSHEMATVTSFKASDRFKSTRAKSGGDGLRSATGYHRRGRCLGVAGASASAVAGEAGGPSGGQRCCSGLADALCCGGLRGRRLDGCTSFGLCCRLLLRRLCWPLFSRPASCAAAALPRAARFGGGGASSISSSAAPPPRRRAAGVGSCAGPRASARARASPAASPSA